MAIKIYSHNYGEGSRLLAEAMNVKILKKQNSRWRPRPRDYVINWGSTQLPRQLLDAQIINQPDLVSNVINKRTFFELTTYNGGADFDYPRWWTDKEEASRWLWEGEGTRTLVARTVLRGHEGIGIILCDNLLDVPDAPLYTAYVKKRSEYRVHVINGAVVDAVEKKRKRGYEGQRDHKIRNTANGYVFARNGVVVPQCVLDNAVKAVRFYQLDFGAVDVAYNAHYDKAYVLEINTAPGIIGTTVQKYSEAFRRWLR